jgi:hypothetical protein
MPPEKFLKKFHFRCQFFNIQNEKNADGRILPITRRQKLAFESCFLQVRLPPWPLIITQA